MSEHEAIRAAVVRVLHHVDLKQWDALPDLFTDEVETDYTSLFGGEVQRQPAAALVDGWRGVLARIVTQHLLGPVDAEVDGDQATARCHVRGYHVCERAPGGPEWMVAGHYTFRLRRGGAGWRIHHLTLATLYQTGNRKLLQEANT